MYHAIVRRQVRQTFAALSRGDYEPALAGMAPRFEHTFAGSHPLGGTRHTAAVMRRWFERLYRLNRHLGFTIKRVAVSGTPWDTTAIVEWRDAATLASGEPYVNDGAHVVRMRWGKVVSLHAYLDTEVFAAACRRMAGQGVAEAATRRSRTDLGTLVPGATGQAGNCKEPFRCPNSSKSGSARKPREASWSS